MSRAQRYLDLRQEMAQRRLMLYGSELVQDMQHPADLAAECVRARPAVSLGAGLTAGFLAGRYLPPIKTPAFGSLSYWALRSLLG